MQKEITEVVGMPGAGKTTWAKKRKKNARIIGLESLGRFTRLKSAILFSVKHPSLMKCLVKLTLKERVNFSLLKHKTLFLLFSTLTLELRAEKSQRKKVIIDGGIIQYIFTLSDSDITSEKQELIEEIIEHLPQRKIVWFFCSKEERRRRMEKRGRVPRSGFDSVYQEKWFAALGRNQDVMIDLIKESKHIFKQEHTG